MAIKFRWQSDKGVDTMWRFIIAWGHFEWSAEGRGGEEAHHLQLKSIRCVGLNNKWWRVLGKFFNCHNWSYKKTQVDMKQVDLTGKSSQVFFWRNITLDLSWLVGGKRFQQQFCFIPLTTLIGNQFKIEKRVHNWKAMNKTMLKKA